MTFIGVQPMADSDPAIHAGDALFEEFVEQVKQVLEHLYDFAFLQQHPLARIYDKDGDLSAKTAGRQLRQDLLAVIESLRPHDRAHFRSPVARLYNILHQYYVENLTIREVAIELGLSERQAYRDLRRGQERVAAALWDKRLPEAPEAGTAPASDDFSFDSELARLKVNFSSVDLASLAQQASASVERLAHQHEVEIVIHQPPQPITLFTDPGIAHQVLVSVLSYAIQRALPGKVGVEITSNRQYALLTLRFSVQSPLGNTTSVITKLAQIINWKITFALQADNMAQVTLHTMPEKTTILIIDDNEGWVELVGRFLEGYNCVVVSPTDQEDSVQQVEDLNPALVILDVMMPKRDGWEVLQRLRAYPPTARIPIIVCSVFNDPQLAYSLGASAFVAKPTNWKTILETMEQLGVI